jgi:hypothetical protein
VPVLREAVSSDVARSIESDASPDGDDSRPIYRIEIWAVCSDLVTTP